MHPIKGTPATYSCGVISSPVHIFRVFFHLWDGSHGLGQPKRIISDFPESLFFFENMVVFGPKVDISRPWRPSLGHHNSKLDPRHASPQRLGVYNYSWR